MRRWSLFVVALVAWVGWKVMGFKKKTFDDMCEVYVAKLMKLL